MLSVTRLGWVCLGGGRGRGVQAHLRKAVPPNGQTKEGARVYINMTGNILAVVTV